MCSSDLGSSLYHEGVIDNAFVYKGRALSQSDVNFLYNGGAGLNYNSLTAGMKTNLVAWWDLDEISGTRFDSHGPHDLTDTNSVEVNQTLFSRDIVGSNLGNPENGVALIDNVWEFDGVNDYIDFNGDLSVGNTFTFDMWLNMDTFNSSTILCTREYYYAGSNGNFILRLTNSTTIDFASYDGTSNTEYQSITTSMNTSEWFNLTLSCEIGRAHV